MLPSRYPLFLLPIAMVSFVAGSNAVAADRVSAPDPAHRWLEEKAAYYEAHPELKDLPGSGWKPFNRVRWEYEVLTAGDGAPDPGARWRAWEETERRMGRAPTPRAAWFQLGPENLAGRMLAIAFHPVNTNTVYAGAAGGGLWRTTDGGSSWQALTDEIPTMSVSGVAVSLTNPDIIVITTGELPGGLVDGIAGVGILRSTDAGATWGTTGLQYDLIEDHGFHIVEAGPNGTFLAGAVDGLWRSSDDGVTWDLVRDGGNYFDVKWKPGDPNTVYTVKGEDAAGNNVKISTDDGLTWTKAGTGQPLSFLIGKSKIAVTPADPEVIYAAFEDIAGTSFTGLYRSTDGGGTWTLQTSSPNVGGGQGWYNLSLAVDNDNADNLLVGGVSLFRSTNGGLSLTTSGTGGVHVDHHDARWQPGTSGDVWVASDGGIYESTNDGNGSWSYKGGNGLITYQFYDICIAQNDETKMAGGTQDNGTDIRLGSNNWVNGLGGDGMVCNIDPTDFNIIYGESQFGNLAKSTNCGQSWFPIQNGLTGQGTWVTPVDISRVDPLTLYTMRSGPGTYKTTNGGASWSNVSPVSTKSISISRVDGDVVWLLDATTEYTTDGGSTWATSSAFPFATGGVFRVLAHPTDVASAFVTFAGFSVGAHLAYTTDFGSTWADVSGDLPKMPVRAIAVDVQEPDHWYIGTDLGVWASTNGGANWTRFGAGLPNAVIWDLEIHDSAHKLVAGTHGRGAWEIDLAADGTDAPEIAGASLELMLDRPMPNPARDQVVLRWASKRPGPVAVNVYDVSGRLVTPLVARDRGDGIIRQATWMLDDVPAGVYFAVLEAGDERVSRKVVVVE
ncbi:MAG: T9SS type A sorting domain-containing protein [Gemmatimonadetes bacterium]|nr:T9SS type A sorting domain-containing protein [Gemmatimonadota bacterium]